MRFVKSLLMLLMLVTFSTGFGKTTADLKQSSKTECIATFGQADFVAFDFASVVDFNAAHWDAIFLPVLSKNDLAVEKVFKPNHFAIIMDVGWESTRQQYRTIHYREKLLENYNLHFKDSLNTPYKLCRDQC